MDGVNGDTQISLVLNETQLYLDRSTVNHRLSSSSEIQVTHMSWLSKGIDFDAVNKANEGLSCIRVIYEFELDAVAN